MASTQNGKQSSIIHSILVLFPIDSIEMTKLYQYFVFYMNHACASEHDNVKQQSGDVSDNEFHDAEDVVNQVFEEKFSDALDLNDPAEVKAEPEEPEPELTEEEKLANKEKAEQLKQDGNTCFKNADYDKSIEIYTEAIAICPKVFNVERSILFSNRAAAHKHLEASEAAIEDCSKSIELNPNYIKAYAR